MKLNWFSPVPPTPSSIAFHTAAILPALARKANVTLWVHESSWSHDLEEHARVRQYYPNNVPEAEIGAADATFYHLGNQPDFHSPIWRVNRRHPGIVVLHDLNMQQFFAGLVTQNLGLSPVEYRKIMQIHHPNGGSELAEAFLSGERSAEEIYEICPLMGAALENATGVAVHTQIGYSLVSSCTTLPVVYVPLFALPERIIPGGGQDSEEKKSNENVYRIIMFGFMSANRRLESILKALGEFRQKDRFRLDIYGTLENGDSVRQMIGEFGLQNLVTFHGFVSDADLIRALSRADLAVNLRDPTMGEASSSQLRIWQHGLPSLVTEVGWYATLPKNTVAFVRRQEEVEDIRTHLANFLRSPETYRQLGQNGRRYVSKHHTVKAYLRGLLDLVRVTRPRKRLTDFWPRRPRRRAMVQLSAV